MENLDAILGDCDDETFSKHYNKWKSRRDAAKANKRPFAKYEFEMKKLINWRLSK